MHADIHASSLQQKTLSEKQPVLIVGAGPTGLMAGLELTRLGIPVRIIDKLPEPRRDSRALVIQARTMELLAMRGLADTFLEKAQRVSFANIHRDGKKLGQVHLNEIDSPFNGAYTLPQYETEKIFTEALFKQNVSIERGCECVGFSQQNHHSYIELSATLKHADQRLEVIHPSYIICAEGAHSIFRSTLNLPFNGKTIEQNYLLADVVIEGDLPQDGLSIFSSRDAFVGVFPYGNHRFRLMATEANAKDKAQPAPTLEELVRVYREVNAPSAAFKDMLWSSRFTINSRHLENLSSGAIFFGGDAAHIHSPAGGQGMNTGIHDMVNLCWKLALVTKGLAPSTLLASYEQERLPIIHDVVSKTEVSTEMLNSHSQMVDFAFKHIAPFAMETHSFQKFITGFIGEVSGNYRDSELSHTLCSNTEFKAGDRLPNTPVTLRSLANGLYQDFSFSVACQPTTFTVFIDDNEHAQTAVELLQERLRDLPATLQAYIDIYFFSSNDSEDKEKYNLYDSLIIARPDGYAGFVGKLEHAHNAGDWLLRIFSD